MLTFLKGIVDFLVYLITLIYNFEIEFFEGQMVKLGTIITAVIIIVLILALVLNFLGIKGGDKNDE